MAHDSQVAREELPEVLRERKSASSRPTGKQSESLAVLRDWWALYGQIYRDDPTELLAQAFKETLQDVPADVLHEACLKAQRECPEFRPTPGRVHAIAMLILEKRQKGNRPTYLDEPITSQSEREAAMEETEEQRAALKRKLGIRV